MPQSVTFPIYIDGERFDFSSPEEAREAIAAHVAPRVIACRVGDEEFLGLAAGVGEMTRRAETMAELDALNQEFRRDALAFASMVDLRLVDPSTVDSLQVVRPGDHPRPVPGVSWVDEQREQDAFWASRPGWPPTEGFR